MKVIPYSKDMYPNLKMWWESYGDWEAIPECLLPSTGWVVEHKGRFLAAGFVYKDESCSLGMMEWIVANPLNTARESVAALNNLISHITDYADENSIVLFTTLRQKKLSALYVKHGFQVGDTGMTNLMRVS